MSKGFCQKPWLLFLLLFAMAFYLLEVDAFARVGGGRSMGSRGSRSSTPPRSYTPPQPAQPTQPGQQMKETVPPPAAQPAPAPQGSFLRGLGGGILGGLIGGMLFRSLGYGAPMGGFGGGIGIFEILLLGLLAYGIYRFARRRRQPAVAEGYYESSGATAEAQSPPPYRSAVERPRQEDGDLEKGLSHVRQMDPSFDVQKFQDLCMDHFFKIQGAWANHHMLGVKNLLTDEMFRMIEDDISKLKMEHRVNRLENIAVRSVDPVEAWQESGKDFVTVRVYANLLDYTLDEKTGQVVSGSKTDPVKFLEYWTFTRPVGNNPWQLSAIDQTE